MDKCIIHFEQVTEEHLVELKDQALWETLLNAAKIRKFEPLIELDKNLGQSDIPAIKYHRKCRSLFTLKRDLQKLNSENDKSLLPTSSNIRSSNRNSSYPNAENVKNFLSAVYFVKKQNVLEVQKQKKNLIYVSNFELLS